MQAGSLLACPAHRNLQRPQIIQQILLVLIRQLVEETDYLIGLGAMASVVFNRSQEPAIRRRSATIVQEEDSLPYSPQGSGTKLITRGGTLRNIISQARPHMMEQQIRK